MKPWLKSLLLISGMLLTGTINTLTKKVQFEAIAPGYYNHSANGTRTPHHFNKPWFQTWTMFLGEILCLFVFLLVRYREKKRIISESLFGDIDFNVDTNSDVPKYLGNKIFAFVFSIPALIDMASSTLQGIGLLFIDASVWQMMRGSLIIFTGLLSVIFLKRRLRLFNWVGILFNVAGLCLVGISSIFKSKSQDLSTSPLNKLLGVFLVLLGSLGTASQLIVEEKLLKGKNYHPLHAVGMEGVFGFFVTGVIALPIVHFIPGNDLNGSYENFVDAIFMTFQSGVILSMVLLNIFSIAFFNYFGLALTKHLTAVHRTLIDTVRTVFVWLSGLIIYAINEQYGEGFDKQWGLIQIDGFALLIMGTFIYNKLIKLDWIPGCDRLMSTDDVIIESDVDITISNREEDYEADRVLSKERTPLIRNN